MPRQQNTDQRESRAQLCQGQTLWLMTSPLCASASSSAKEGPWDTGGAQETVPTATLSANDLTYQARLTPKAPLHCQWPPGLQ